MNAMRVLVKVEETMDGLGTAPRVSLMGCEGDSRQHTCHSLVFTFGASGVLEGSDNRGSRDRRDSDSNGDRCDVKSGKDRFGDHAGNIARDRGRNGDVSSLESCHKPQQHDDEGVTHLDGCVNELRMVVSIVANECW